MKSARRVSGHGHGRCRRLGFRSLSLIWRTQATGTITTRTSSSRSSSGQAHHHHSISKATAAHRPLNSTATAAEGTTQAMAHLLRCRTRGSTTSTAQLATRTCRLLQVAVSLRSARRLARESLPATGYCACSSCASAWMSQASNALWSKGARHGSSAVPRRPGTSHCRLSSSRAAAEGSKSIHHDLQFGYHARPNDNFHYSNCSGKRKALLIGASALPYPQRVRGLTAAQASTTRARRRRFEDATMTC